MGIADPLDPDYQAQQLADRYPQGPSYVDPVDIVGQPNSIPPTTITGSPQAFAQGVRNIIRPPPTTITGSPQPLYEDTSASERGETNANFAAMGMDPTGHPVPKSGTERQIADLQSAQGLTPGGSTSAPTPGGTRQPVDFQRDEPLPPPQPAPAPAGPPPSVAGRPIAIAAGPPKSPAVDKVSKDLQDAVALNQAATDAETGSQLGLAGQLENRAMIKDRQVKIDQDKAEDDLAANQKNLEAQRADAAELANFKVDPNRYMNNKNWFQKSMLVLSATLGGGLQGLNKLSSNPGLDEINKSIDRDIQSQEQEYNAKKAKGQTAQSLYAMNLRALGNRDAAMAASKAQATDALNDHFQAAVASTNSPTTIARGAQVGNALQTKRDLYDQERADALKKAMAGGKPFDEKRYDESEKLYWEQKRAAGETGTADEARAFALRSIIHNGQVAGGGPNISISGKAPKEPGEQDKQRQIEATEEALDKIRKIKAMVAAGGRADPARTAEGKSLVGGAVNAISRAETGGNRAPSEAEQKLIREQVTADPNGYQFTGAELARMQATEDGLEEKLARLRGHPATVAKLGGEQQ